MTFADKLKTLPDYTGHEIVLTDANGQRVASILNAPGTAGSFRVYAYLAQKFGAISPHAATEGLEIFAEHTLDARAHPGKHPNIDRLLAIVASGIALSAHIP